MSPVPSPIRVNLRRTYGTVYLVVEGRTDAAILRRVLPLEVLKSIEFVIGEGKSSAVSTARTLLALGDRPVGLLADADAKVPPAVAQERRRLFELLNNAAHGLRFAVFLAVPTLDNVFRNRGAANKIRVVQEITHFVKGLTN